MHSVCQKTSKVLRAEIDVCVPAPKLTAQIGGECYQDRAAQDSVGRFRELRLVDKLSVNIQFVLGFHLRENGKRKTRELQFEISISI